MSERERERERERDLIGVQNQKSAKRPFNSTFLSSVPTPFLLILQEELADIVQVSYCLLRAAVKVSRLSWKGRAAKITDKG